MTAAETVCRGECRASGPSCGAESRLLDYPDMQYICTRDKDHEGLHSACGDSSQHDLCVWPQEEEQ